MQHREESKRANKEDLSEDQLTLPERMKTFCILSPLFLMAATLMLPSIMMGAMLADLC